jgi:DnaJ-class molecular chaperone
MVREAEIKMEIRKVYDPEGKLTLAFPRNHDGLMAAFRFVRQERWTHLSETKTIVEKSIGTDSIYGEAFILPCSLVKSCENCDGTVCDCPTCNGSGEVAVK